MDRMPPKTPWSYPKSMNAIPQDMVIPTVRALPCACVENMIVGWRRLLETVQQKQTIQYADTNSEQRNKPDKITPYILPLVWVFLHRGSNRKTTVQSAEVMGHACIECERRSTKLYSPDNHISHVLRGRVGIRLVMHLLTLWKGYNRIVPRGVNNVKHNSRED